MPRCGLRPGERAHQLGGSFGFAVLVAVFAAANSTTLTGGALFTHRIASTFTVGSELLVATFGLVMVLSSDRSTVKARQNPWQPARPS